MCFGQPFIWVTDCYAIKFILTYQGMNPTILRLQMQLICWAMEIVHQPDIFNVDTDYWSHVLMIFSLTKCSVNIQNYAAL